MRHDIYSKELNLWYITTVPLSGIIGVPIFAAPSGPMEGPGPIAGPGKVPLLFIFIPIIGGGPWLPAGAGLNASMQNNLYLRAVLSEFYKNKQTIYNI